MHARRQVAGDVQNDGGRVRARLLRHDRQRHQRHADLHHDRHVRRQVPGPDGREAEKPQVLHPALPRRERQEGRQRQLHLVRVRAQPARARRQREPDGGGGLQDVRLGVSRDAHVGAQRVCGVRARVRPARGRPGRQTDRAEQGVLVHRPVSSVRSHERAKRGSSPIEGQRGVVRRLSVHGHLLARRDELRGEGATRRVLAQQRVQADAAQVSRQVRLARCQLRQQACRAHGGVQRAGHRLPARRHVPIGRR